MKWHQMNWTDKIAELLIYSTAIVFANITLIFWYSISESLNHQLQGTGQFIIDLINYSILLGMLSIIIFITISLVRKIK